MHEIIKDAPCLQTDIAPSPLPRLFDAMPFRRQLRNLPATSATQLACYVSYATCLLRQLRNLPATLCDLAAHVLTAVVCKAVSDGAQRVDMVWDTYPEMVLSEWTWCGTHTQRWCSASGHGVGHIPRDGAQRVDMVWDTYPEMSIRSKSCLSRHAGVAPYRWYPGSPAKLPAVPGLQEKQAGTN
ncbi:hypothetical protein ACOMHN_003493 [Nucella lapillus]